MKSLCSYFFSLLVLIGSNFCHAQNVYEKICGTKTAYFEKKIQIKQNPRLILKQEGAGAITVTGDSSDKTIIINEQQYGKKDCVKQTAIKTEQRENDLLVTIPKIDNTITLSISVPANTELQITSNKGDIAIHGCKKNITVFTELGNINISNATNNLLAQTNNGTIVASFDAIQQGSSITLEASSHITLSIPEGSNGELIANTQGRIISDHYITIQPVTTKIHSRTWQELLKNINGYLGATAPKKGQQKDLPNRFILNSTRGGKIYIQ